MNSLRLGPKRRCFGPVVEANWSVSSDSRHIQLQGITEELGDASGVLALRGRQGEYEILTATGRLPLELGVAESVLAVRDATAASRAVGAVGPSDLHRHFVLANDNMTIVRPTRHLYPQIQLFSGFCLRHFPYLL